MVVYAYNWEAKATGLLIQDQPVLHSKRKKKMEDYDLEVCVVESCFGISVKNGLKGKIKLEVREQ